MTLIDTPGYNDPDGVQNDITTPQNLSKFFNISVSNQVIYRIDAGCFVFHSGQTPLTTSKKYVYHSILSIFGKNVEKNVLLMATHADSSKLGILESAKAVNLPYKEYFLFTNSKLFITNDERKSSEEDQDEDNETFQLNLLTWNKNIKAMKKLFYVVSNLEPQSFSLTKEVLQQRKNLYQILENRKEEVSAALNDLANFEYA